MATEYRQSVFQAITVLAQTVFEILHLFLGLTARWLFVIHHTIKHFSLIGTEDGALLSNFAHAKLNKVDHEELEVAFLTALHRLHGCALLILTWLVHSHRLGTILSEVIHFKLIFD